MSGRRVRVLAEGVHASGSHTLRWDGRDAEGRPVRAGLYLVHAKSGGTSRSVRVVRVP